MRVAWLLTALLALAMIPAVLGITIHGTVYDFELNKLPEAIVEINTTPKQVFVAVNGTYSFSVTPGNYLLQARHRGLDLEIKENITAHVEGDYVLDLILLPSLEEEELLEEEPDITILESLVEEKRLTWLTWLVLLGLAVFITFKILRKAVVHERKKAGEKIEKRTALKRIVLPEELQKILDFVEKEGGRTTQKEIRKNFPYSEAKISLMIDELEAKGLVKRLKKGRGNIILRV